MKGDWIFSGSGEEYDSSVCVASSGGFKPIFSSKKKFALLILKGDFFFNVRSDFSHLSSSETDTT